jgi:hypothetical protein
MAGEHKPSPHAKLEMPLPSGKADLDVSIPRQIISNPKIHLREHFDLRRWSED